MPTWEIVGLPDIAVKESKERIRTAIRVALLKAMQIIKEKEEKATIFIGELSLNGDIKSVNGILPMCIEAMKHNIKRVIIPYENYKEASIVKGLEIVIVKNLTFRK